MALTKRQRQIYDYISDFVSRNGYSPSFEEIGDGMGLSSLATVHKHVSNLEKKGLLKRDYNRSRSIDVLPPKGNMKKSMAAAMPPMRGLELPLIGQIVAGQPLQSFVDADTLSLSDFTSGSKDVYVLKVVGESMQDEHIIEGDYVIVEDAKTARNGEIVVAEVDGTEATLKRFYHEGENIRLQPSNSTMKPIIVHASKVLLRGRVVGVLRKY